MTNRDKRSRIYKVIEKYAFKKRYILRYDSLEGPSSNIEVVEMSDPRIEDVFKLCKPSEKLHEHISRRKGNDAWVAFFFLRDGCILGYSFLHVPTEIEWNDSLPTLAYEARVSNQFVYPEYRGRGVVNAILRAQSQFAKQESRMLWAVIEKSNFSSMKAGLRAGRIVRKNYLVKLVGRNVISILTNPFRVYLLTGWRRARR